MSNTKIQTDLEVRNWSDCQHDFKGADLLLGNGFSINLSSQFRYASLFKEFLKECTPEEICIFEAFQTSNFEAIQKELQSAVRVNKLFGLSIDKIEQTIDKLRNGLIQAIEKNHPRAAERDEDRLYDLAKQFSPFGNIFTLNYDLLLYHIIMIAKSYVSMASKDTLHEYNDHFWESYNSHYLRFMEQQKYTKYKHVYYLHGALFLFDNDLEVLKLKRTNGEELINRVAEQITQGRMPLFVSEGTWQDKLKVINRSPYLRFVLDKLKKSNDGIVIYGTSLSKEHDQHIINAINTKPRRIAVSVYTKSKSKSELDAELHEYLSKLRTNTEKHLSVDFFDSTTLFDFERSVANVKPIIRQKVNNNRPEFHRIMPST